MKIGFITMHRVCNFGSALQAYALQKSLFKLGYDNEIIDYIFPSSQPISKKIMLYMRLLIYKLRTATLFQKQKTMYFKKFFESYCTLSKLSYTKKKINKISIIYDVYMTGSDQVWNPSWIKDDTTFLLSFAPKQAKRVSYASSFAVKQIPEQYFHLYSPWLSLYDNITVREYSGIALVNSLCHKNAQLVLDPTLLLTSEEYNEIVIASSIQIKEPFILVYILTYMYNPFPEANSIVKKVHETIGGKVIYLSSGKFSAYSADCLCLENIGPCEFVWLFKHASFVITSSFHGSAFASIFHKPLIALVKSLNDVDERIPSLLKQIKGEFSIIPYNLPADELALEYIENYQCSCEMLDKCRMRSLNILKSIID